MMCVPVFVSIPQIDRPICVFSGNNMNVFLNENWREVLLELQPAIEDVFAVAFKSIGQQFLNRVPRNVMFLD